MLPFLKQKAQQSGISVIKRKPDEDKPMPQMSEDDSAIEACAQDICEAISSKDYKRLAQAIKSVFQVLESMPHEEGPHLEGEELG